MELRVKVCVRLRYDGNPLDGDVHLFVDGRYLLTVHTVNGYAEVEVDVEGVWITGYYEGSDDFEPCYAKVRVPSKFNVGVALGLALAEEWVFRENIAKQVFEKTGVEPTDDELDEIVRFYKEHPGEDRLYVGKMKYRIRKQY